MTGKNQDITPRYSTGDENCAETSLGNYKNWIKVTGSTWQEKYNELEKKQLQVQLYLYL